MEKTNLMLVIMWVPSVKKANLLFTRGQIENGCFEKYLLP